MAQTYLAARLATTRLGLIADTHGLLRPQALAALRGVDAIVHAGDIGSPDILETLARIAPVTAVRGNNDRGTWARRLPRTAILERAGARILVVHDRNDLEYPPRARGIAVVVSGHSHRPLVEEVDGVLFVNPGSAGPRRFRLPVAVARLEITRGRVRARVVTLDGMDG